MSPIRLWLAASHDPAHRNGGWAYVRSDGEVAGAAGGARRTTRAHVALAGFSAALQDLPPGRALAVVTLRPDALVLQQLLTPPADAPADDLDLRAKLAKALSGRTWTLTAGDPAAATPLAFAAAWADLGSDKAKMGGAFIAAIPRTNLAKLKGL